MSETPTRFVLEMIIRDTHGYTEPVMMAVAVDEALRISPQMVEDLKVGADLGVALVTFDQAVTVLKKKEMRRDVLRELAHRLAMRMADRLEDAEGWHDASRVEPARAQLGGRW